MFEFDRTAFSVGTFREADSRVAYWRSRPPAERLLAADVLIRRAYGLSPHEVRRVDRTVARVKIRRMAYLFGKDLQDFIQCLNEAAVDYLLVGGYAVILHGYNRTTENINIWVNPTSDNFARLVTAFHRFGLPLFDLTESKFLNVSAYDVWTYGVPPNAIDLMPKVKGLDFSAAYANSSTYEFDDLSVRLINYHDLITAKRAAGRLRDLNDIEQLERGDTEEE